MAINGQIFIQFSTIHLVQYSKQRVDNSNPKLHSITPAFHTQSLNKSNTRPKVEIVKNYWNVIYIFHGQILLSKPIWTLVIEFWDITWIKLQNTFIVCRISDINMFQTIGKGSNIHYSSLHISPWINLWNFNNVDFIIALCILSI